MTDKAGSMEGLILARRGIDVERSLKGERKAACLEKSISLKERKKKKKRKSIRNTN